MNLPNTTLFILVLVTLPSLLLLKEENNNAQAALVDLALEKEETGAKADIPPFLLQVDAHGASLIDCQELSQIAVMPMMVDNEAFVPAATSHLLVCIS